MRIAYLVSQFPSVTETFVLRELDCVAKRPELDVQLLTLKHRGAPTVHRAAGKWLPGLRRGSVGGALTGLAYWLCLRPLRLLSSLSLLGAGYAREPRLLLRALAAFALGAGHARLLRRSPVQHLHAHFAGHPAVAAWVVHRMTGTPYSITTHAYDLFLSQAFLRRMVCDARFVVAISEYNRTFLEDYRRGCATPVHLVHTGVDPAAYPFRRRQLPAEGPVRAICVASLQVYKGQRFLLEALASGHPPLERLHLRLVGDGPERKRLETLAGSLGLGARVSFLGNRTEEEVAALLDESDLFVLPSTVGADGQMEGLPVCLMEALACGLPTVATRVSGVPELVRDPETGYLSEESDPESLADALARVLEDPASAQERGSAGRRLVEAEFDVADNARRLAKLFVAA